MLTRLYVDNFRCLVDFELKLDRLNLLLGDNGSGKTNVFEVLRRLQGFIGGELKVDGAFPSSDLTRWEKRTRQAMGFEAKVDGSVFTYALEVEHDPQRSICWVDSETLKVDGRCELDYRAVSTSTAAPGTTTSTPARGTTASAAPGKTTTPAPTSRVPLSNVVMLPETEDLLKFKGYVARWIVASLQPACMKPESKAESRFFESDGANFASWYRHLSQQNQNNIFRLREEIREAWPSFVSFQLAQAGETTRVLKASFNRSEDPGKAVAYSFDELSDGQRQLIVLYCMLYGISGEGYSLFLDEPDNYVTLREIQPWLMALEEECGTAVEQATIISHHPEVIDFLAPWSCIMFERPEDGPVRIADNPPQAVDGLKLSETIARGWT